MFQSSTVSPCFGFWKNIFHGNSTSVSSFKPKFWRIVGWKSSVKLWHYFREIAKTEHQKNGLLNFSLQAAGFSLLILAIVQSLEQEIWPKFVLKVCRVTRISFWMGMLVFEWHGSFLRPDCWVTPALPTWLLHLSQSSNVGRRSSLSKPHNSELLSCHLWIHLERLSLLARLAPCSSRNTRQTRKKQVACCHQQARPFRPAFIAGLRRFVGPKIPQIFCWFKKMAPNNPWIHAVHGNLIESIWIHKLFFSGPGRSVVGANEARLTLELQGIPSLGTFWNFLVGLAGWKCPEFGMKTIGITSICIFTYIYIQYSNGSWLNWTWSWPIQLDSIYHSYLRVPKDRQIFKWYQDTLGADPIFGTFFSYRSQNRKFCNNDSNVPDPNPIIDSKLAQKPQGTVQAAGEWARFTSKTLTPGISLSFLSLALSTKFCWSRKTGLGTTWDDEKKILLKRCLQRILTFCCIMMYYVVFFLNLQRKDTKRKRFQNQWRVSHNFGWSYFQLGIPTARPSSS